MLAMLENERPILEFRVRKNRTLAVTNLRVVEYDSDHVKFAAPVQNVRSITPIKKDKIRIQLYVAKDDGSVKREYKDFDLDGSEFSANQICHRIIREHEKLSTFSENRHGMLILQPHEHVISVFQKIKTNKGTGLFYLTNLGIALETEEEGIIYDVPFYCFKLITSIKRNKIRIIWNEAGKNTDFKFEFEIKNDKLDRDAIMSMMQGALADYRRDTGYSFMQYEQKYSQMTPDDVYALAKAENPEYQEYLRLHATTTFGFGAPIFFDGDILVIRACKLLGFPIDLISEIPPEELEQRKTAYDFATRKNKHMAEIKIHKDELDRLEKECGSADDLKKLQKSDEYKRTVETITKLIEANPEFKDPTDAYNMTVAQSMRAYDRQVNILYEEWKKSNPLPEFEDEYGSAWVEYLIEKLNNFRGKNPLRETNASFDDIQAHIKKRDRNTSTLDMFVKPEGIPEEDIYNNCWHDKNAKIWYVQDDNLNELLRQIAISDPDHSQGTCGRRAWGFGEDVVQMACGFPSVMVKIYERDWGNRIKTSRKTGLDLLYVEKEIKSYILPILKEEDLTEEFVEKFGDISYEVKEFRYVTKSSGTTDNISPKVYDLYCKKFGLKKIPLAERVRRGIFATLSGVILEAEETEEGLYHPPDNS